MEANKCECSCEQSLCEELKEKGLEGEEVNSDLSCRNARGAEMNPKGSGKNVRKGYKLSLNIIIWGREAENI